MNQLSLDLVDEMERMRKVFDRILGDDRISTWTFPFSRVSFLPGRASRSYPLMNISEDDENIYVDALAPGVGPDTLNVSVAGDQLLISGQKTLRGSKQLIIPVLCRQSRDPCFRVPDPSRWPREGFCDEVPKVVPQKVFAFVVRAR
jgi:HSP20 family molecular chaperone IbpA